MSESQNGASGAKAQKFEGRESETKIWPDGTEVLEIRECNGGDNSGAWIESDTFVIGRTDGDNIR